MSAVPVPAFVTPADFKYVADASIDDRVRAVMKVLQGSLTYFKAKRIVKEDYTDTINDIMEETKISTVLQNATYSLHLRALDNPPVLPQSPLPPAPVEVEAHESVAQARRRWTRRVCDELNAVALEQNIPLSRLRKDAKMQRRDDETPLRCLFDDGGLFGALVRIPSNNHVSTTSKIIGWGLIKVEMETPSPDDLRSMFAMLSPDFRQVGLDDEIKEWFKDDRYRIADRVRQSGAVAQARQFCKRGAPAGHRGQLWQVALGAELGDKEMAYYEQLMKEVEKWSLLTDDLFRMDVRTSANDDNYFVFEDMMDAVLLPFQHDSAVMDECAVPITALGGVRKSGKKSAMYPPSGVLPFKGFSMLLAPVCFLYAKPEQVYFTFRQLYARYFCKMHTISSLPGSILHLCKTFEMLVQTYDPEMCYHLLQLGIHPLRIAFPWLFYGFVGYLESDQILILWDRMVGFDTLFVFPVLAAAIFVFRSQSLLKATCVEDVQDVFQDPSRLKVLPLMQHFLFQMNVS